MDYGTWINRWFNLIMPGIEKDLKIIFNPSFPGSKYVTDTEKAALRRICRAFGIEIKGNPKNWEVFEKYREEISEICFQLGWEELRPKSPLVVILEELKKRKAKDAEEIDSIIKSASIEQPDFLMDPKRLFELIGK